MNYANMKFQYSGAGHAFLGVKLNSIWIYIESTCLGVSDFLTAVRKGREVFNEYFLDERISKVNSAKLFY